MVSEETIGASAGQELVSVGSTARNTHAVHEGTGAIAATVACLRGMLPGAEGFGGYPVTAVEGGDDGGDGHLARTRGDLAEGDGGEVGTLASGPRDSASRLR